MGQTEASPWTRQRTVSLLTLAPSAGLSCILIRSLEAPSASLSLSPGRLWSLAAPVVMLRQNKTNSRIDRCYGQWCVEFSSLVRGAPNPRTPALHIIEFPTVASEWLGFFFFFLLCVGGKLPFCTDGSVFSKCTGSGTVTGAVWMGRILRSRSNSNYINHPLRCLR